MNHQGAEDVEGRRAALRKINEHILGMSGLYTRVGNKLGFDRSYVSRVARGQRYSPIVAKALIAEFENIMGSLDGSSS
jgi:hypothetical protein